MRVRAGLDELELPAIHPNGCVQLAGEYLGWEFRRGLGWKQKFVLFCF